MNNHFVLHPDGLHFCRLALVSIFKYTVLILMEVLPLATLRQNKKKKQSILICALKNLPHLVFWKELSSSL